MVPRIPFALEVERDFLFGLAVVAHMDNSITLFNRTVRKCTIAGLVGGTCFVSVYLGLIGLFLNSKYDSETQAKLFSGVVFIFCLGMVIGCIGGFTLGLIGGGLLGLVCLKLHHYGNKKLYRNLIGCTSVLYGFTALTILMRGLSEIAGCMGVYETYCIPRTLAIDFDEFLQFLLIPAAIAALWAAFTARSLVREQQQIIRVLETRQELT